jgi:hypothetical protein
VALIYGYWDNIGKSWKTESLLNAWNLQLLVQIETWKAVASAKRRAGVGVNGLLRRFSTKELAYFM